MDNNIIQSIDNSYLFFKVWRNLIIKIEIFKYFKVYYYNGGPPKFKNTKQLYDSGILENGYRTPIRELHLTSNKPIVNEFKIPDTVEICKFRNINQNLNRNDFPSSITVLEFGHNWNQMLKPDDIPDSVTELSFLAFSQLLKPGILPGTLKKLKLLKNFSTDFQHQSFEPNSIPYGITDLEISTYHITDIPLKVGSIPLSVKKCKFFGSLGHHLKVGDLPYGLEELEIYGDYGKQKYGESIIEYGAIPSTVKTLSIGIHGRDSLPSNAIPLYVENLTFSFQYPLEQQLKSILDPLQFIQRLDLGTTFRQELQPNSIPMSVTSLKLGRFKENLKLGDLNNNINLIVLEFGDYFESTISPGTLPPNLKKLVFGSNFNNKIIANVLPSTLTSLKFGSHFNQSFGKSVLPRSLTKLILGHNWNQPINNHLILPSNLKTLKFGYCFNQIVENIELTRLTTIGYNPNENSKFQNCNINLPLNVKLDSYFYRVDMLQLINLPKNVTTLEFDNSFNKKIVPGILSKFVSITTIKFGNRFNKKIRPNSLPPALTSLSFGFKFNRPLTPLNLPCDLKELTIDKCFNQSLNQLQFTKIIKIIKNNSGKGYI